MLWFVYVQVGQFHPAPPAGPLDSVVPVNPSSLASVPYRNYNQLTVEQAGHDGRLTVSMNVVASSASLQAAPELSTSSRYKVAPADICHAVSKLCGIKQQRKGYLELLKRLGIRNDFAFVKQHHLVGGIPYDFTQLEEALI